MAELPSRRKPSALTRRRLLPTRDAQGRLLSSPGASADTSASPPSATSLRTAAIPSLQQLYFNEGEGSSLFLDRSISRSVDQALHRSHSSRSPPTVQEDDISLSVGTLRREARALLDASERHESRFESTFHSAVENASPSRLRRGEKSTSPPHSHTTPRSSSLLRDRSPPFYTPATAHGSGNPPATETPSVIKHASRPDALSLRSPLRSRSPTSSNSNSEEKTADEPHGPLGRPSSPSPRSPASARPCVDEPGSFSVADSEASRAVDACTGQSPSRTTHNHEASLAAQIALPPSPAPGLVVSPACDSILSDSDLSLRPDKTVPYSSSPLPASRSPTSSSSSGSRQWAAAPIASPHPSSLTSGHSRTSLRGNEAAGTGPASESVSRVTPATPSGQSTRLPYEKRERDLRRQIGRKAFSLKANPVPEPGETTVGTKRDSCSGALHDILDLARDLEVAQSVRSEASGRQGDTTDQTCVQPAGSNQEISRLLRNLVDAAREAQAAYVGEKEGLRSQLEMEVRRGDTLAEALAHAEMDTERRLLLAREQARSEARHSVELLLDQSAKEGLEELTRARDERDAARTAIGRALEIAEKADAVRLKMRDELQRAQQERDDALARTEDIERRLALALHTQAQVDQAETRALQAERRLSQVQRELESLKAQEEEWEKAKVQLQNFIGKVTEERDEAVHRLDEQELRVDGLCADLASIQTICNSSQTRIGRDKPRMRRDVPDRTLVRAEELFPREVLLEDNRQLQEILQVQQAELDQLRRTGGLRYVVPSSSSNGPTTIRRYNDPLSSAEQALDSPYRPLTRFGRSKAGEDETGPNLSTTTRPGPVLSRKLSQAAPSRFSSSLGTSQSDLAPLAADDHS